ncbi:MAG: sigma-70 family RNA polymerase sigma factor [Clostridium butyricum]|nr:sigma-70 family RNA polymerase sigma factor [Clostridium butyricum]
MDYAYIENLVLKSKAHDINSKEKILEEFRPFIIRTSKNIFIDGYTFDDIVNECYKTLFACIKSYDSQTHRFVAYATISIKNNIHYLLRKSIKRRNSEGKEALVLDDSLKKAIDALTDDEKELINCIYYEGNSIKTYAQMKNISYFNVFHARKKIFNKLHTFMG